MMQTLKRLAACTIFSTSSWFPEVINTFKMFTFDLKKQKQKQQQKQTNKNNNNNNKNKNKNNNIHYLSFIYQQCRTK